jgi:hypothetical protein
VVAHHEPSTPAVALSPGTTVLAAVTRRIHSRESRMKTLVEAYRRQLDRQKQKGGIGWVLLWLLGIPIPVLIVLFLLRGCT